MQVAMIGLFIGIEKHRLREAHPEMTENEIHERVKQRIDHLNN